MNKGAKKGRLVVIQIPFVPFIKPNGIESDSDDYEFKGKVQFYRKNEE